MTVHVAERQFEDVYSALAAELCCLPESAALQRTLVAQHIRTAIYIGSTRLPSSADRELPNTQRLMAQLRRNLDGILSSPREPTNLQGARTDSPDIYRTTLDSIADLGDVVDTGGGHWLSAPLRLVEVEDSDTLLVLGGHPLEVVRAALGVEIASAGVGRFTGAPKSLVRPRHAAIMISLASWFGTHESLSGWTRRAMDSHLQRLSQSDEIAADHVELYAPDILRSQHKQGRWLPAAYVNQSVGGPRLFRPLKSHSREYARPYYLGIFEAKETGLVLLRSVPVEFEVSRRLRFGLDEMLKSPRSVNLSVQGDICTVDLRFKLPEPENRVMSLGWTAFGQVSEISEIVTFHHSSVPMLIETFRRLSVRTAINGAEQVK